MNELHVVIQLIIIALAAARVTVLVVEDTILDVPRGRLLARLIEYPSLSYLVTCHRCAGFWVSVAWVVAWWAWPDATTLIGLPFAVAAAAWWLGGSWMEREA